jgi:hypothetical protein
MTMAFTLGLTTLPMGFLLDIRHGGERLPAGAALSMSRTSVSQGTSST